jgi:predicted nucleotidyltransferase
MLSKKNKQKIYEQIHLSYYRYGCHFGHRRGVKNASRDFLCYHTPMITREKIKEIADKIAREFKPEKIILFGSFAWGTPTEDSDIDLLVVKETEEQRIERAKKIRRSLHDSSMPMDILVYTPRELQEKISVDRNLFLEDVVNNGVVLYVAH